MILLAKQVALINIYFILLVTSQELRTSHFSKFNNPSLTKNNLQRNPPTNREFSPEFRQQAIKSKADTNSYIRGTIQERQSAMYAIPPVGHHRANHDNNFGYSTKDSYRFLREQQTSFSTINEGNDPKKLRRYGGQENYGDTSNPYYSQGGYGKANDPYQYNYNERNRYNYGTGNSYDMGYRQVTYDIHNSFGGGVEGGQKLSPLEDIMKLLRGGGFGLNKLENARSLLGHVGGIKKALKVLAVTFGLGALSGGVVGHKVGRVQGFVATSLLSSLLDKIRSSSNLFARKPQHNPGYLPSYNTYNEGSSRFWYNSNHHNSYGGQFYYPMNGGYTNGQYPPYHQQHFMMNNPNYPPIYGRTMYRK